MQRITLKEKLIGKLSRVRRWQHTKRASVMKRKALGVLVGLLVLGGVALTFAEGGDESGSETANNANANYLYTQTGVYCGELSAADYDPERFEAAFTASTEIDTDAVATCEYYDEDNAGADAGAILTAILAEENGSVVFLAENTEINASTESMTGTENADTEDATSEAAGPEDQTANETETVGGAEAQTQTETQTASQTLDFTGITILTERKKDETATPSLTNEYDIMTVATTDGGTYLGTEIWSGLDLYVGCTPDSTQYGRLAYGCVLEGEGLIGLPTPEYVAVSDDDGVEKTVTVEVAENAPFSYNSIITFLGESDTTYEDPFEIRYTNSLKDQDGNFYTLVLHADKFFASGDRQSYLSSGGCFVFNPSVSESALALYPDCGASGVSQTYSVYLIDAEGNKVSSGDMLFGGQDVDTAGIDGSYSNESNTNKSAYAEGFVFSAGQTSQIHRAGIAVEEADGYKYTPLYVANTSNGTYNDVVWGSQETDSASSTEHLWENTSTFFVALGASGASFTWTGHATSDDYEMGTYISFGSAGYSYTENPDDDGTSTSSPTTQDGATPKTPNTGKAKSGGSAGLTNATILAELAVATTLLAIGTVIMHKKVSNKGRRFLKKF